MEVDGTEEVPSSADKFISVTTVFERYSTGPLTPPSSCYGVDTGFNYAAMPDEMARCRDGTSICFALAGR